MGNLFVISKTEPDVSHVSEGDLRKLTEEVARFFELSARTSSNHRKAPRPSSSRYLSDDLQSKSTESTTGSPDLSYRDNSHNNTPMRREVVNIPLTTGARRPWFLRASPPDLNDRVPPMSVWIVPDEDNNEQPRSTTQPVKCPAVVPDDEESEVLQRMYDMRTWDMYLRITESRKQQQQQTQRRPFAPQVPEMISDYGFFECPSTLHAAEDDTEPGHELFFGDLD